jgi:dUTP pyrophosphatase
MKIKIWRDGGTPPAYETPGSAGMDLRARVDAPLTLEPGERVLVPTGIHIQLPEGVEAQIRARSGLAVRNGISLVNGVGTVDSDYRGEIMVAMINLGDESFRIEDGDRIAQMVVGRYERVCWEETDRFDETERGAGGFGHTGR